MVNGISSEMEKILDELKKFIAIEHLWKDIKECSLPAENPKFGKRSKVVLPYISTNLVVTDICYSNNVNVYLLEYECNNAYKLIVSEECISCPQ